MTKKVHMFMNTSTAFKYETGGRDWREMACWTNGEYQDLTNMSKQKKPQFYLGKNGEKRSDSQHDPLCDGRGAHPKC